MHIWGHLLMSLFLVIKPQRPWILISFAVNCLMVNYVTNSDHVLIHLLGNVHSLSSPSIPFFFATKAWVPSLEMQGPSYKYMIFRLGDSILQYHVFMTQSLAPRKKPATDDSVLHQTASMHFACQPLHDSYTIFIFVTMMISDVVLISYNIFSKMPTNMHLWDQLEAWYIFLNTQPGQFVIASDECCASCCHFICLLIWKISSSPLQPIKKHTQSLAGTCTQ